jgi:hypothetical protein
MFFTNYYGFAILKALGPKVSLEGGVHRGGFAPPRWEGLKGRAKPSLTTAELVIQKECNVDQWVVCQMRYRMLQIAAQSS